MTATVIHGDCLDVLRGMADASVDAVVTDPPAGIAFMGKAWDRDKGGRDEWIAWLADIMRECARVMKPGAHAVVWALPRTSHWTGMAIENAGLEVRDKVTHHFGSGFPKSHNLPGGIGTALKPASEDWWVARKPLVGTVAANVAQHGTGAINVDGCRVAANESTRRTSNAGTNGDGWRMGKTAHVNGSDAGRWPPNLLLTHSADCGDACADDCPVAMMDRQSGYSVTPSKVTRGAGGQHGRYHPIGEQRDVPCFGDSGGASRFFPTFDADPFLYQAKASQKERFAALICDCEALHSDAWESADREQNEPTGCTSLARDTSEATSTDGCGLLTSSNGSATTAPCPPGTKSTTATRTSRTTQSTILSSLTPQPTSACTPGANSGTACGGSRAARAESSSPSTGSTSTSHPKAGRSTGVVAVVTSRESSKPSACARCGEPLRREAHPTQKPTALMQWLVRLVTPPDGTILDPFAGSGTTLVAALAEGRQAIGIEREAEYVEIVKARLANAEAA